MIDFKTTREQLAMVAVKNHSNGALNPDAQFQKGITLDQVLKAQPVATPLGMFDCAPVSDGAAAVVLAEIGIAHELRKDPIKIVGMGQGSDSLSLANRCEITGIKATRAAAEQAYRMAGISSKDISVAEVHDSYTIGEIMAIEDLGFIEKGKGGIATENGETAIDGRIPVNTSGGLKARGHPLGATGIAQIVELTLQLRNNAGKRQVTDARYGLAQNVGGTGGTVVVHVLEAI
jgi:acetyl-CoA C-acetyltransferase